MKHIERKKKWIGTAIAVGGSIAQQVIGGINAKKQAKRVERANNVKNNRINTLESARAMSSSYGNQDYVDDYKKKVVLKLGGKTKYKDRFSKGRKKKKAGGQEFDINALLKGVQSGVDNFEKAKNNKPVNIQNIKPSSSTISNEDILDKEQQNKEIKTTNVVNYKTGIDNIRTLGKKPVIAKLGTRSKKNAGAIIGSAVGAGGGILGSILAGKNKPNQEVDTTSVSTSKPKVGLVKADYEKEYNNDNNVVMTDDNGVYKDRLAKLKLGSKIYRKNRK